VGRKPKDVGDYYQRKILCNGSKVDFTLLCLFRSWNRYTELCGHIIGEFGLLRFPDCSNQWSFPHESYHVRTDMVHPSKTYRAFKVQTDTWA